MSTLIRCLDNEMQCAHMRNGETPENSKHDNYKMPRSGDYKEDDNERLDTLGGDDDYDGKFFDNDNDEENKNEKDENMKNLILRNDLM